MLLHDALLASSQEQTLKVRTVTWQADAFRKAQCMVEAVA